MATTSEETVTVITGAELKKDLIAMGKERGFPLSTMVRGWMIEKRNEWRDSQK